MTYFHEASSRYFVPGDPFTLEGVLHPGTWFERASAQQIADAGFVVVVDVGTAQDGRYFENREELVGAERRIISTPKPAHLIEADNAVAVAELVAKVRELREKIIVRINDIAARLARKGDADILATTDAAVEALLEINKNLPGDPAAAELAIMQRFFQIRATLPESMHKAFAGVDE